MERSRAVDVFVVDGFIALVERLIKHKMRACDL